MSFFSSSINVSKRFFSSFVFVAGIFFGVRGVRGETLTPKKKSRSMSEGKILLSQTKKFEKLFFPNRQKASKPLPI